MLQSGETCARRHYVGLLAANGQRWWFIFAATELPQLYELLGRYAADPELSFTWTQAGGVMARAQALVRDER